MYIKRILLFFLGVFFCHYAVGQGEPKNITIKAVPGLKFDLLRFSVAPGTPVVLTLINSDDMDHNMLITSPGKRQDVVDAATALGDKGPLNDYIPSSPAVLWSIPIIGPGEKVTIEFTAPEKPGAYPYVCTYPGHGFVMYGVMHVTNGEMPPLESDPGVPKIHLNKDDAHAGHHGRPAPYLYRTFIEDIGPATIAVRLSDNLSYAFDAVQCRFRYAWEGAFLNMEKLWAGHKQATAIVLGDTLFVDKTTYPIRIGRPGSIPNVQFKGYRLIEGIPEFHYTLNGLDVYELIEPREDGTGLVRSFRIPEANQAVWFYASPNAGTLYTTSVGEWEGQHLKLSAEQAKEFKISLIKKN